MMTYSEKSTQLALDASTSIIVQVLLSRGNDDIELIPLHPRQRPGGYITREEFAARQLRAVGTVGLNGLRPVCVFKEPLESSVVDAIIQAFTEYAHVLLGGHSAEHVAAEEVAELNRLWSLPDNRAN
jgi:hypothetical protein